jgi:hypothetical protein
VPNLIRRTARRLLRSEAGMTTAEYAVGTIAACAFAGLLLKVVTSGSTMTLLSSVVKKAFDPFLG